MMTRYVAQRRARGTAGFTLVEVLFAIAILGVGIVGILTLFISGINMAGWAGSRSQASMESQSLYAQILSYCHPSPAAPQVAGMRNYIEVMRDKFYPGTPPKWSTSAISIWVQQCNFANASYMTVASHVATTSTYTTPARISAGHDYYWQCRVTNYMMDKKDPIGTVTPAGAVDINPPGLVEVALAIYKQWKPSKEPLAVYTTLLSLESK